MPATSRYPGESDEAFKMRMAAQFPNAGVPVNVPPLPMGGAPMGMMGGMGGAPPMGPPPVAPPMQDPMAQGPSREQMLPQVGPPKPPVDPNAIPESVLDSLLQTPIEQGELLGLEEQRERANALRDTALPEGRQAGRTFVAANPLEFIGAGIKQYRGAKESKELQGKIGEKRTSIGTKQGTYTKEAAKQGGLNVVLDKFRKKKDDEDKD